MYRIGSIFYCCFCLSLAVSCMSVTAKRVAATPIKESNDAAGQIHTEQPPKTANPVNYVPKTAQRAARLLPELTQAVNNYDVHKAFALFGAIYESCNGQENNKTLIDARQRIQPLLNAVSLEAVNQPAPVSAGSPFTRPFAARIVITAPEKQIPLDNYPVTVLYPSSGTGSSLKTDIVRTDTGGFLYFTPPIPEKACDGTLFFYLSPTGAGDAASLAAAAKNLSVSFPYKVATKEKRVPTIIAILDYDENNTPVFSSNTTATRLLTGLMKRGFSRVGLDEYRELAETDEVSVIHTAQSKIGTAVDRFIFGRTHITVEPAEDNTFVCTIRADISIWDFKQTRKVHQFTFEHTAKAGTKAQAISLARTDLGETVIAETFNYSL